MTRINGQPTNVTSLLPPVPALPTSKISLSDAPPIETGENTEVGGLRVAEVNITGATVKGALDNKLQQLNDVQSLSSVAVKPRATSSVGAQEQPVNASEVSAAEYKKAFQAALAERIRNPQTDPRTRFALQRELIQSKAGTLSDPFESFHNLIKTSYADAEALSRSENPLLRAVGNYSLTVRNAATATTDVIDNAISYWEKVGGAPGEVGKFLAGLGATLTQPLRLVDARLTPKERNQAIAQTTIDLTTEALGGKLIGYAGEVLKGTPVSQSLDKLLGRLAHFGKTAETKAELDLSVARSKTNGLIEQLKEPGKRLVVARGDFNLNDLAALTARTNREFAVLTRVNPATRQAERMIIAGDALSVPLNLPEAKKLAGEGWTLTAHSHVDKGDLTPSGGDRRIVGSKGFNQPGSIIVDSENNRVRFVPGVTSGEADAVLFSTRGKKRQSAEAQNPIEEKEIFEQVWKRKSNEALPQIVWGDQKFIPSAQYNRASELPVIIPGTKQWTQAVQALRGGGTINNLRLPDASAAKQLLKDAFGESLQSARTYTNESIGTYQLELINCILRR